MSDSTLHNHHRTSVAPTGPPPSTPSLDHHTNDVTIKSAVKDVTYGSVAGMVSKVFEHPFDLVKVRLQAQSTRERVRFTGPIDCFGKTFRNEGFWGLYRGLSMPVLGAMIENATLFLVYNQVQRMIKHISGRDSVSLGQLGLSAGCAGACASFVLTPVELIKCRMQVQQLAHESKCHITSTSSLSTPTTPPSPKSKLPGPIALVKATIKQHGVRGLWLGQTGTLLRETGGSAAWFTAFEVVIRYFLNQNNPMSSSLPTKSDLADWQLMVAGACGGISYNALLFPADSIKSTIQTSAELGEPRRGFIATGRQIWAARGFGGLYAGCGLTCLRSAPSSALIFWIVSRLEGKFD